MATFKYKNIIPAPPIGLFEVENIYKVTAPSPIVTQLVSVPSSKHVAEIIGKLWCKIKALKALTGTHIKTLVRVQTGKLASSEFHMRNLMITQNLSPHVAPKRCPSQSGQVTH